MSLRNISILLTGCLVTGITVCLMFYDYRYSVGLAVTFLVFILLLSRGSRALELLSLGLIISLFLIPSVSVGGANFRVDDYISIFLGICLPLIWKHLGKNRITSLIVFYLIYCIGISVVHLGLSGLRPLYMLFLIKETQYFLYFFIFYYLTLTTSFEEKAFRCIRYLSALTMLWGLFQVLSGSSFGYYGIGIISSAASSHSGVVFLLITIFFIFDMERTKIKSHKLRYAIAAITSSLLTVATISRVSIVVLVTTWCLYFLISLVSRRISTKRVVISLYFIALGSPVAYFLLGGMAHRILERLNNSSAGADTRMAHWSEFISNSDRLGLIFGNGKGFMQKITGNLVLGADNQYVRNILEIGVFGTIIWAFISIYLLIFAFKRRKTNYEYSLFITLLTVGFLALGITHEVFLVSIQASLFWIFVGVAVGKMDRDIGILEVKEPVGKKSYSNAMPKIIKPQIAQTYLHPK